MRLWLQRLRKEISPPYVMSIEEFRKILGEYNSAFLLVEECDISQVPDVLEACAEIWKDSFHKMYELEQKALREGFTFAHP